MTTAEMADLLVRLDERLKTVAEQMDRMVHAIEGNGREGLISTVARQDERLKTVEGSKLALHEKIALYTSVLGVLGHTVVKLLGH